MTTTPNTRLIAGIPVPDTPLITSILSFLHEYYDEHTWNHVNRSWLLGSLMASKTPVFTSPVSTTPSTFDSEIHAISALTHDLAWDCRKPSDKENFCTKDKRFEIDCANAAIKVLKRHFETTETGEEWDVRKLQLVWDAIALHGTPSIATHKEPEVAITCSGITADFFGPNFPGGLITWEEWEAILVEFPMVTRDAEGREVEFKDGGKKLLSALCEDKPETTYDNFVGGFGERYVEGYTLEGNRPIDHMMQPVVRK